MNERPMRRLGVSRRDLFDSIERPALRPLRGGWEYAKWRRARVGLDYHVEVDEFYYSAPHTLLRAEVDVRVTARTIEMSAVASVSAPISAAMVAAGTGPIPINAERSSPLRGMSPERLPLRRAASARTPRDW